MLGGGSDGAHNAPDYGEKQAIFMQFAGKERAQSLHLVYREAVVTRRAARPAACRHRRRHRSSGGAGSRRSRRRGAAPRGHRGRGAAPAPRTARRCPSEARPSRSCRCRPSSSVVGRLVRAGGRRLGRAAVGCVVRRGLGRRRRARRGVAAARVGLALLRERERAADLFLRVRVVENVRRQLRDRLGVAVERIDLADPPVVVPVGDHLVGAAPRLRHCHRGLAAHRRHHHECDEQEAEAQGAMKGEGSNHDAERADCPGSRGVWQVSRLALSRW